MYIGDRDTFVNTLTLNLSLRAESKTGTGDGGMNDPSLFHPTSSISPRALLADGAVATHKGCASRTSLNNHVANTLDLPPLSPLPTPLVKRA